MSDQRYPNQESAVPSQAQPRNASYFPNPVSTVSPPMPPGPSGTIPADGFVISTFDARPIDGYDFLALQVVTDPLVAISAELTIPPSNVLILRSISLSAFITSNLERPFPTDLFLTTPHGLSMSLPDFRLDVLRDNVSVQGFSDIPISGVEFARHEIPCYILADANETLRVRLRFGENVNIAWQLSFEGGYIALHGQYLSKTGRNLQIEPASRSPVPTIDGKGYGV